MSLDLYVKTLMESIDQVPLKRLTGLAKKTSNQYALYYYLYKSGKATLPQLYKVYCEITGKRVRIATLRKQLRILEERYKVVKKERDYYVPLIPPEELSLVINPKKSVAGRKGALKRILNLNFYNKPEQLKIPQNLAYYIFKVYKEVQKLLRKDDKVAALDLIAHTYLPLRKMRFYGYGKEASSFIETTRTVRSDAYTQKKYQNYLRNSGTLKVF